MSILTECPSCQRKVRVPEDLLDQHVQCPTCGKTFLPSRQAAFVDEQPAPSEDEVAAWGYQERPAREWDEEEYDEAMDEDPEQPPEKPPQIQLIGVMMVAGGIVALLLGGGIVAFLSGRWPGLYYSLLLGVLIIVRGAQLMGPDAYRLASPRSLAIMQMINVINLDVINVVLGALALRCLKEPEVQDYFQG